jgi:PAS domain S-box-containing protein
MKQTKKAKKNASTLANTPFENNSPINFMEKIFDAIPMPLFVKDRAHRWVLLNKSLCDLQEKTKEELLYNNDYDFFPKEQADRLFALEEEIFVTRQPLFTEEYTLRNGKESYVLISKTMVSDNDNNDYIVGGCIDITERKKAELLIEESERRFRSLVQNSPDIITILEKDATIRYVTPSFYRLLGFSTAEVVGSPLYKFAHIEDVFILQQKISEMIKTPGLSDSISFKAYNSSGDWVILDARITNLLHDPSVNGIVINASDITKISNQEAEILRMNQLLEKDNIQLKEELSKEVKARVNLKTVDFEEFHKVYPDDDSCYKYLSTMKWKDGYRCKKCKNTKWTKGKSPFSKRCTLCGFDESPLIGTIFYNQKFSITKGFYMAFLITSQNRISSNQLSTMVSLRKDTCASFKRKFLLHYKARKSSSKIMNGWESFLLCAENKTGKANAQHSAKKMAGSLP